MSGVPITAESRPGSRVSVQLNFNMLWLRAQLSGHRAHRVLLANLLQIISLIYTTLLYILWYYS